MQRNAGLNRWAVSAIAIGALTMLAALEAQPPAAPPARPAPAAGRGNGGRFKNYPADAVTRGLTAYNTTCGYCHGERGKGGKAGPDLIASLVTLHDEDGVGIKARLNSPEHLKSRIVFASGRGNVHVSEVLVGDPKAGQAYFNGAGGCNKCHSATGDLKGVGAKYDAPTLQERIVLPRTGRGGFGRGSAPNPTAPTAVVTLASGQSFKGSPVRVTDFDVTLRLADGSTRTWAREHGVPKVDVTDPLQAHIDIMRKLSDPDMHNLTAYLATLK
jgi:mono/diheme cytochrome c family protein